MTILDEEDCLAVMFYDGVQQFDPIDEFCVGSLTGFTGSCYVSDNGFRSFICRVILNFVHLYYIQHATDAQQKDQQRYDLKSRWAYSRINRPTQPDPEKKAKRHFLVFLISISLSEVHVKSFLKFDKGKGSTR